MKTGLTLGKYSPFHQGHENVFKRALAEVDRLIVLIYNSPETTNIPLQVRADWLRTLYPQIEVIEAWDGPTEVGNSDQIKRRHEIYLQRILKGRDIDAFYTAESYGDHVSKALDARWQKMERGAQGISGTEIRKNPFDLRQYLNPYVYKDFVLNIVFLGAPSTGKTTLCQALAARFQTEWMPEYGREYWEKNQIQRRLTEDQLLEIAREHLRREDHLLYRSNRYLFTDTNAMTTLMFSRYYHRSVSKELNQLAHKAEKRYDLFFLCDTDIPYENSWDRSGDVNRQWFQRQIEADLKTRKIPYIALSGSLDERMERVGNVITGLKKYDNIWTSIWEGQV